MRRVQIVMGASLLWACGSEAGTPINAPSIEPPVTRNMPQGFSPSTLTRVLNLLVNQAHAATDASGALSDMDRLVFGDGNGPTHFREQLRQVDDRMASLDRRAADSPKDCLNAPPTAWTTPPGLFPHESSYVYTLQLQCYEALSPDLHMAFGIDEGQFYLIEASVHEGDSHLTLATAAMDGSQVEIWRAGARPENNQSNFLYVRAFDGQGIEFSYGGHTAADGTSCGMRLRNDETSFYTEGVFSDALNQPGDCSEEGAAGGPGELRFCASSGDLTESATADCGALTDVSNIPDLNYTVLGTNEVAQHNAIRDLVSAPGIDSLAVFATADAP